MPLLQDFFPEAAHAEAAFTRTGFANAALGETLCCAATVKYLAQANANPSIACVITTPELAAQARPDLGVAVSDAPQEAFYSIHNLLCDEGVMRPEMPSGVHETADIHPTALVEDGVSIGPGVVVEALAFVGRHSWLENGVRVGVGARIGIDGHFYKRFGGRMVRVRHAGGVHVRSGAQILANAMIQRALYPDFTTIGAETVIGPGVHLAHGVQVGERTIIAGSAQVAGYSSIGDDVWVGPGAVVGNLLSVGSRARVEIGSVVVKPVPEGARVSGNFARPHTETLRTAARLSRLR
ncbi:MAG: hypothetical protein ACXW3D_04530 [Caulobacteraceae bacterium]